jgi:hypothetical protein
LDFKYGRQVAKTENTKSAVTPKLMTGSAPTKFGAPGVLMNAIKSCKIQLDQDAALGVQGASRGIRGVI